MVSSSGSGGAKEDDTVAVSELSTLSSAPIATSLAAGPTSEPLASSRYVVLDEVGAGAMGVVRRAYDTRLRREVALKSVRLDTRGSRDVEAELRLLREARALARLNHPNVLTVYDVEEHEGTVVVATELVEGRGLDAWLEQTRSWSEVLDVMLQAARGLGAAHAADLVHRDFKPANVLFDVEGRVRVMDFGIARYGGEGEPPISESGSSHDSGSLDSQRLVLTTRGMVLGTPAYMAPEQHAGQDVDARSDQYAFFVTFWEALWGRRPFSGNAMKALLSAKMAGPPAVPGRPATPRWLHPIILRGLSPRPEDRFASMDEVVRRLERGRHRARRRKIVAVSGTAALAIGGLLWGNAVRERRRCEDAGRRIDEVWNDTTRAALRTALEGTKVSYAATTADKVVPWLDAYGEAWSEAATEVCLDADVRKRWDAGLVARADWCLEDRRLALGATIEGLSSGTERSVSEAVQAASALDPLDPCLDAARLSRLPAPPTGRREEIASIRGELSRATAMGSTGSFTEALEIASDALARAQEAAWPPLVASAHRSVGDIHEKAADYEAAKAAFEDAFFVASGAGELDVAREAALALAHVQGLRLARLDEAMVWLRHVELLLGMLPDPSGELRAQYLIGLGSVHADAGRYAEAETLLGESLEIREAALGPDHLALAVPLSRLGSVSAAKGQFPQSRAYHERALAIHRAALGPTHPTVAVDLNNIGLNCVRAGDVAEAMTYYEQAIEIWRTAVGPDHPEIAQGLNNFGLAKSAVGAYDEAETLQRRALEVREKAFGPDHPDVAMSLFNLAGLAETRGEHEEARRLYERSQEIWTRSLGPNHRRVAGVLNNLASVHMAMGHFDQAIALNEEAIARFETILGKDHPDVGTSTHNLAFILQKAGRTSEARAQFERAMKIRQAALGATHPEVGSSAMGVAETALALGRKEEALAFARKALALREGGEVAPVQVAYAQFVLAQVLWETQTDREEALRLARQARETIASDAVFGPGQGARSLEAWLAEHGAPVTDAP